MQTSNGKKQILEIKDIFHENKFCQFVRCLVDLDLKILKKGKILNSVTLAFFNWNSCIIWFLNEIFLKIDTKHG